MDVVRLYHGGVPCALPAAQAVAASSAPPENAPPVELWPSGAREEAQRFLHVETDRGLRSLPCAHPRTAVIPDGAVVELPPLVRGILRMPWVAALAEVDGELFWVLDARAMVQDRDES